MKERAITLSGAAKLAAIITLPDMANRDENAVGVLILNEGILHRVGAGRLHVKVARRMAELGFISLRLDHSSIGDSGPRRGTEAFEQAAVAEVQVAMDYLTKQYGLQKFIVYGLCSGSDVAFELGVLDDRVAGLIQLDAHIYTTKKSEMIRIIKFYGSRALRLSSWKSVISRNVKWLIQRNKLDLNVLNEPGREEWYADPDYIRVKPPFDHVDKGLRIIVNKNIPMYLCFTDGGYYGVYNYVDQYRDAFSSIQFEQLLEVQFIVGSTHLFTALKHQQQLMEELEAWMEKHDLLPKPAISQSV